MDNKQLSQLSPEQQAVYVIKELRRKLNQVESQKKEPIAIVGMSCRFPDGASSPEAFWKLLEEGHDAMREIPPSRWDVDQHYDPDPEAPRKAYTRYGAFVEDVEKFDPLFFGISPREAIAMDPQQRLLLEAVYEAIEGAGGDFEALKGSRCGVYLGIMTNDYARLHEKNGFTMHSAGAAPSAAAGRISFVFGLNGPCMSVDTACSSSLVAISLACQSLREGKIDAAVAAGTNLILTPEMYELECRAHMLSPDGRCKTFDESANGYARGEGCGVIYLKRLSDAIKGKDPILAVIRGSSVNQDGASGALTVPNGNAQIAVMKEALQDGGVDPLQVSYIEAHGTGTSLGDPIEMESIIGVYGKDRKQENPLFVGSVKTNIGHLEGAAGIAGVIKVVLSLNKQKIPSHLHLKKLNPKINLGESRIEIPTKSLDWRPAGGRCAAVSSFGFSGTNAHIVLEEAPSVEASSQAPENSGKGAHLLVLSAKTSDALAQRIEHVAKLLSDFNTSNIADLSHTSLRRREHYPYRMSVTGTNGTEIADKLRKHLSGEADSGVFLGPKVGTEQGQLMFVYSGSGSQWVGMGRDLFECAEVFRNKILECDAFFKPLSGWSLAEELKDGVKESRLEQTEIYHPLLFAIQVGISAQLNHWGLNPDGVMGHSVGEVAAAYESGALSLEDAVKLIYHRSRLIQGVQGKGKVLSVKLSMAEAESLLVGREGVSVAGSNSPGTSIVAGASGAIEALAKDLEDRGVYCKMVKMDFAAHSEQMDPLKVELEKELIGVKAGKGQKRFFSTVYAKEAKGEDLASDYWGKNLRQPVRFSEAVESAARAGFGLFVEISPHPVLALSIKETLEGSGQKGQVLATLRRHRDEVCELLAAAGSLHSLGQQVDLTKLAPEGKVAHLPSYPFQRNSYWLEMKDDGNFTPQDGTNPLLGKSLALAQAEGTQLWNNVFSTGTLPYLKDHRVGGRVVFPGAAFIEMSHLAGWEAFDGEGFELRDVSFLRPLLLSEGKRYETQLQLSVDDGAFKVFSRPHLGKKSGEKVPWQLNATGKFLNSRAADESKVEFGSIVKNLTKETEIDSFYQRLANVGLEYHSQFRSIKNLWKGSREAFGEIIPLEGSERPSDNKIHPAVLDCCFQVALAAMDSGKESKSLFLPFSVEKVAYYGAQRGKTFAHAKVKNVGPESVSCDISIYSEDGSAVAVFEGFSGRKVDLEKLFEGQDELEDMLYQVSWEKSDAPLPIKREDASGKTYLIFSDAQGVGQTLKARLEGLAAEVFEVFSGPEFRKISERRFECNPLRPSDFRQLFESLPLAKRSGGIEAVFLWALDLHCKPDSSADKLQEEAISLSNAAMSMARELAGKDGAQGSSLHLVTRSFHATARTASVGGVVASTLWGLGKSLALEVPKLFCKRIDLPSSDSERQADTLCRELNSRDGEDQVAWGEETRRVARLSREDFRRKDDGAGKIEGERTYLITGGMGSLGLKLAKWLVQEGATHLVLTGRSELSETSRGKLQGISQNNSIQTVYLKADMARFEDVDSLFQFVDSQMPPLAGIFHVAGVLEDRVLDKQDLESLRKVFSPKVAGAWNLHLLSEHRPLDFFVLFSSAASLLGSPGQTNYAAANAFLDALAQFRRMNGKPSLSVNWGAWEGDGLAENERIQRNLSQRGMKYIKTEVGFAALKRLINSDATQAGVFPIDWGKLLRVGGVDVYPKFLSKVLSGIASAPVSTNLGNKMRGKGREAYFAHPVEKRGDFLQRALREAVASVGRLKVENVAIENSMNELGFDSLMGVELRNRIESEFALSFPMEALLKADSLAAISKEIESRLAQGQSSGAEMGPKRSENYESEFPLSSLSQKRLWYMDKLSQGSAAFNIPLSVQVGIPLDISVFEESFNQILKKHSALRARFEESFGKPAQKVSPFWRERIHLEDLSGLASPEKEKAAEAICKKLIDTPFDNVRGPLFRQSLLKLDESNFRFILVMHHLITDWWSNFLLLGELSENYRKLQASQSLDEKPLPFEFVDYVKWQEENFSSPKEEDLKYWAEKLQKAPESLALRPRRAGAKGRARNKKFLIPNGAVDGFLAALKGLGLNLYSGMMGVFGSTLADLDEQRDFLVAAPVWGRYLPEASQMLGDFSHPLLLRVKVDPNAAFGEFAKALNDDIVESQDHSKVPFEKLIAIAREGREDKKQPRVDAIFSFVDVSQVFDKDNALHAEVTFVDRGTPDFPLFLFMIRSSEGIFGVLEYDDAFVSESLAESLVSALMAKTNELAKNIQTVISDMASPSVKEASQGSSRAQTKVCVASNFSVDPMKPILQKVASAAGKDFDVELAPFNQAFHQLLDPQSLFARNQSGVNILMLRLEDWVGNSHASGFDHVAKLEMAELGAEFLSHLESFCSRQSASVLVFICPPSEKASQDDGFLASIKKLQEEILVKCNGFPNVMAFDAVGAIGSFHLRNYLDSYSDTAAHIPYKVEFFQAISVACLRAIACLRSSPRKVLVLDCDNTLWGGVCGEESVNNLRMDPGKIFLQQFAKRQGENGMLLCICSKNEEADVRKVFAAREDFPLKWENIVEARVNWRSKSENILEMANSLNLGLDSFVFLDDNPIECEEVRSRCPQVLVVQVPSDDSRIPEVLENIWAFDKVKITDEDRKRSEHYKENVLRERCLADSGSFEEFIKGLGLKIDIKGMIPENLARISQLTFRTNQFNFTSRRRSEGEILSMVENGYRCFSIEVRDRFGEYGLVGVVLVHKIDEWLEVETFLLSCRVLGKGVEHEVFRFLGRLAETEGLTGLRVQFSRSERNTPAIEFLQSNFEGCSLGERTEALFKLPHEAASRCSMKFERGPKQVEIPQESSSKNRSSQQSFFGNEDYLFALENMANEFQLKALFEDSSSSIGKPLSDPIESALAKQLKSVWEQTLAVGDVEPGCSFFEAGGDSIRLVQLLSQIKEMTGVTVAFDKFIGNPTLSNLTRLVEGVKEGPQEQDTGSDLLSEVNISEDVRSEDWEFPAKLEDILLTGSTGFLGAYLLKELLEQTEATIHCLVRASNTGDGFNRIQKNLEKFSIWDQEFAKRIVPVIGDFSERKLGLSDDEYAKLSQRVQVIYHNGAAINFVFPYSALKSANVEGVKEILSFAVTGKTKPLHYVSTVAVFRTFEYRNLGPIQEGAPLLHWENLIGYAQSKWIAEQIVEMAKSRGVPVTIYRPGAISGDVKTWKFGSENDLTNLFLKGILDMGVGPALKMSFDFTPVDYVSKALVYLSLKQENVGKKFHLINPTPFDVRDLLKAMQSYGFKFQVKPYAEWREALSKVGPGNALFPFVPLFQKLDDEQRLEFPPIGCRETLRHLKGSGITCPPMDDEFLNKYFDYFVNSGFLNLAPSSSQDRQAVA